MMKLAIYLLSNKMDRHIFCITITFIITAVVYNVRAISRCSNELPPPVPEYHLIEKCHGSKLGLAAKARYASLTSCQRLGIEKKALSLNFSPPEAVVGEPLDYTCEVLKCAEVDGGPSLENNTRFDYYSLYGKPLPNANSTCVPATGMFRLLPKKYNFTEGQQQCRNISGVLSDVTSEQRTDALSQLLTTASIDAAFVGLRRRNTSAFYGLSGDTLDCTTYRAWAPGHPRRYFDKFDCVVITHRKTWVSTSCTKRYHVLCELIPGGPYKRGSIFRSRRPVNGKNPDGGGTVRVASGALIHTLVRPRSRITI